MISIQHLCKKFDNKILLSFAAKAVAEKQHC